MKQQYLIAISFIEKRSFVPLSILNFKEMKNSEKKYFKT